MVVNKENMNIKEAANYLNCSISMIRKLIYNDEIPTYRIGNKYYFQKEIIDQWIINKHNDIDIGGDKKCI